MLPLAWFACTSESPSRTLERLWLTFSPFALGLTRAVGFLCPGPRRICRQIPRTSSPVLGRHLSGLPHRALLRWESQADPAFLSKLLALLHDPSAYPNEKTPFFTRLLTERSIDAAVSIEGPASRVWLPSGRRQPFRPRKPLSASHALGLLSSGLCPDSGAESSVSQEPFRSCASSPTLSAWYRRFSGFRLSDSVVPSCSPTVFQVRVGPWPS
jgi:hypothetical protein